MCRPKKQLSSLIHFSMHCSTELSVHVGIDLDTHGGHTGQDLASWNNDTVRASLQLVKNNKKGINKIIVCICFFMFMRISIMRSGDVVKKKRFL